MDFVVYLEKIAMLRFLTIKLAVLLIFLVLRRLKVPYGLNPRLKRLQIGFLHLLGVLSYMGSIGVISMAHRKNKILSQDKDGFTEKKDPLIL